MHVCECEQVCACARVCIDRINFHQLLHGHVVNLRHEDPLPLVRSQSHLVHTRRDLGFGLLHVIPNRIIETFCFPNLRL